MFNWIHNSIWIEVATNESWGRENEHSQGDQQKSASNSFHLHEQKKTIHNARFETVTVTVCLHSGLKKNKEETKSYTHLSLQLTPGWKWRWPRWQEWPLDPVSCFTFLLELRFLYIDLSFVFHTTMTCYPDVCVMIDRHFLTSDPISSFVLIRIEPDLQIGWQ